MVLVLFSNEITFDGKLMQKDNFFGGQVLRFAGLILLRKLSCRREALILYAAMSSD